MIKEIYDYGCIIIGLMLIISHSVATNMNNFIFGATLVLCGINSMRITTLEEKYK